MSATPRCPNCGAQLPADARLGLCPRCLVAAGVESEPAASSDPQETTPFPPNRGAFVPPAPPELADRFADLEILELIGAGGMGAVYKARQKELDRLVAVKILPPEVGADPSFAERFSRESKALARLGHPNIVAIHDAGQRDGLFYFVMEYVDGVSLRQAMHSGELEPQQALSIIAQICEALQFAHDAGIVHRDVKPENVLLTRDGRVKIADFGLAKLVREAAPDSSLTGTAQVMGTFRYMAPEQFEGAASVDHRADIYSLGVVFYELLTGEVPMGRFAPPSKKVQVDVRLDEVVLRSLEREPERRYQQANDVKSDLDGIRTELAPTSSLASPHDRSEPPPSAWAEFKADTAYVLSTFVVIGTLGLPVLGLATYVEQSLAGNTWMHSMMLGPTFGFGVFLWFWRDLWNSFASEMGQVERSSEAEKTSAAVEVATLKGAIRFGVPASLVVSVLLPVWTIAAYVLESRVRQEWIGWHLCVPILGIGLFLWFWKPVLRVLVGSARQVK